MAFQKGVNPFAKSAAGPKGGPPPKKGAAKKGKKAAPPAQGQAAPVQGPPSRMNSFDRE